MVDPGVTEVCVPDDDVIVSGKVEGAVEDETLSLNLKGQVSTGTINEKFSAFGLC